MHDLKALRADPAGFDAALARRGLAPVAQEVLAQDIIKREAQTRLQEQQARRNAIARDIGQAKRSGADSRCTSRENGNSMNRVSPVRIWIWNTGEAPAV